VASSPRAYRFGRCVYSFHRPSSAGGNRQAQTRGGTNTVASIQPGLVFGYAGMVDALVNRIRAEMNYAPKVVATGGLAALVARRVFHHRRVRRASDPTRIAHSLRAQPCLAKAHPCNSQPLSAASLSPAVARLVGGATPAKLMAVRGMAPVRPAELLVAIYQLSFDAEPVVSRGCEAAPASFPAT